jgi:hypothetical protein
VPSDDLEPATRAASARHAAVDRQRLVHGQLHRFELDRVSHQCPIGGSGGIDCPGDLDDDGQVSNSDLQELLSNWANVCPP